MKKQFENIEDFLSDSTFRDWVLHEKDVKSLYWENWIKSNPDKVEVLEEAKALIWILEGNNATLEEEEANMLWDAIDAQLEEPREGESSKGITINSSKESQNSRFWYFLTFPSFRIAMILITVFFGSIGFLLLNGNDHFSDQEILQSEADFWIEKVTQKGEKKRIHLPDGSKVLLNAESTLKYLPGFGKDHRDLMLEGEAYFEVSSDTLLPFQVQSNDLQTVALGTSFIISAYSSHNTQEVKLLTGKVSVAHQAQNGYLSHVIYLNPGEDAMLSNHDFKKSNFDVENALKWTKGILHFQETPFMEVVEVLERWYGVDISVSGSRLSMSRVTGEFKRENLENVLKSISYSSSFDFHIKGKKVMISTR
ncbi:DUF4974 domain-containing protein [Belliella sp. DSM 111904]|uniref:DUF4974 domain-containing protein n=1 Tax=Belliella filtrata TaxID=2923435 RepID=A0ABS9UV97_9BACT|nr:FecR domain-containing protein [Belliella filtrata]MCH7408092.1 DUF4974 domain-containing protein [Belliella filtrata]